MPASTASVMRGCRVSVWPWSTMIASGLDAMACSRSLACFALSLRASVTVRSMFAAFAWVAAPAPHASK
jgi:hypothetical protein